MVGRWCSSTNQSVYNTGSVLGVRFVAEAACNWCGRHHVVVPTWTTPSSTAQCTLSWSKPLNQTQSSCLSVVLYLRLEYRSFYWFPVPGRVYIHDGAPHIPCASSPLTRIQQLPVEPCDNHPTISWHDFTETPVKSGTRLHRWRHHKRPLFTGLSWYLWLGPGSLKHTYRLPII